MADTSTSTPQRPPTSARRRTTSSAADHVQLISPVARFTDGLLAADLPQLTDERRRATVDFIGRRVVVLPSITRFGVLAIAWAVDLVARLVGRDRTRQIVVRLPLPLIAEYPRLIRSLGYAYVWETWPDAQVDGRVPE
jgi:hypothetical protein